MSERPTRILLVEDNPGDVGLLRAMLGQAGSQPTDFELVEAPRLAAAVKRIRESDFGLVLLDLALPDSDGVATVARIKEARPALPIVVMTGQDDAGVAMEALRQGAQDYLVKGQFDPQMLKRAIRYAIERQRSEVQLRQQREREAALRQVGEAIASTLDLDTVLNLFLDQFASLFPDLAFTARLVNPKTGSLDPFATRNVNEFRAKDDPFRQRGVRAQAVMAQGKPLVLVDLLSESRLGNSQFVRRNGFVSYVGIPLIAKEKSIGVVGVYSNERHAFDPDEVEFFSALGRQAAVAIYNSRIHEQAKNAHEREAVLRQITSAVAETLDVRAVLNVLLANIHSQRPDLVANVRLLNRSIGELMGLAPRQANDNEWRDVAVASGRGLTKVVGNLRRPVAITDLQNDPRIGRPELIRQHGFVSYLGVPLIVADDLLGVLNFFTRETYVFENEEVEFLRAVAAQAAIAIHNSQIYEKLKIAHERQAALDEINRAITSTLDLGSVVDLLLERMLQLFPQYAITIRLMEQATGRWWPFASRNVDDAGWRRVGALTEPTGLVREVAAARKPVVISDLENYGGLRYPEFVRDEGLVSYLGVPLMLHDNPIGLMSLYTREKHVFGREEIDFFNAVGAQAAVAISNSRLFERIKAANEKAQVLRQIYLAMTTPSDLENRISILLDTVAQVFSNCAVTLRLMNKETGAFEGLACRNLDEEEWRSLGLKIGVGGIDQIDQTESPVAIVDAQNDPRVQYREFLRRNGLVSYLEMPLNFRGEFVGALGCFTKERHEFSAEEIEFLGSLADQAAVALYNAQLYDRLKDSKETLEKALEAKSVLVGVMAHELKTPIQVILGSAAMLADNLFGELTPEQLERVRTIEAGGEELLELIDNTLQMTRLERGETALVVTEVCVGILVAELQAEFEEAFREKGIELEVDAPPPGVIAIKTDRIKLKEVLRNLLDNARKFTLQGKVTLRAAKIGEEGVEFIVSDTGVGIRSDLVPKIFEWFYQVSYSNREKASAGLGLSIVKRLVEALSGEIRVWSEVGKGTTFRVALPKEIVSRQPDKAPATAR